MQSNAPLVVRSEPRGSVSAQQIPSRPDPDASPPPVYGDGPDGPQAGPPVMASQPFGGLTLLDAPSLRRQAPAFTRGYDLASIGGQKVLYYFDPKTQAHVYVVPEAWNQQTHDQDGRPRVNYGVNTDGRARPAPFQTNDASFAPMAAQSGLASVQSAPELPLSAGLGILLAMAAAAAGIALFRRRKGAHA
jgi:hypothetical protein